MKTLKIFSTLLICCAIATTSFSQKTKTDTFQVSGNCGMCEAKIEKAAKAAGATYAEWNKDTKVITVKYNSTSSNLAKIQKSIADAGYDNVGVKTTTEAYDKLHSCCKYDRTAVATTGGVKMVNALKKVMMVRIVVKKMELQKWIAVRTANALKKGMMVKTAAKMSKIININLSKV